MMCVWCSDLLAHCRTGSLSGNRFHVKGNFPTMVVVLVSLAIRRSSDSSFAIYRRAWLVPGGRRVRSIAGIGSQLGNPQRLLLKFLMAVASVSAGYPCGV